MARDRAPSFQFYPRDFRADAAVDAMTFDQRGRYVWALCASWETEHPGVACEDQWRAWMKYTPKEWGKHRATMALAFAEDEPGVWVQRRMVAERRAQTDRFEKASAGARSTNAKRWHSDSHSDSRAITPASASASASAVETENQTLLSNPDGSDGVLALSVPEATQPAKRPRTHPRQEPPEDREWRESFPLFWNDYPRRDKRKEAFRAWLKVPLRGQPGFDKLMAGLDRSVASKRWQECIASHDKTFIPLPASWLNGERWNDELDGAHA